MTFIKKALARSLVLPVLLVTLLPGLSVAAPGQFYLVGFQAPEGSISSAGQGRQVVYLRWDVLEGQLPTDVVSLRLIRDNDLANPLLDVPVDAVMPVSEIAALYDGTAQQRRLLETMKNLKELAVAQDADFSPNSFADALRKRIDPTNQGGAFDSYDPGWTFLASRNDINVARARYRAYVDDPGQGLFRYELLAVNATQQTTRLGYVEINTTQSREILPPTNFRQVLQSQCHLPELGKDHYTVALNWESPGTTNVSDRLGAQLYIGGYDLYRTTANLDPLAQSAPPRDIRAEASGSGFDNRGNVVLGGLEKINDVPLTIGGDDDNVAEWSENIGTEQNPLNVDGGLAPEWLETQDQLKIAGLKPGDKRAYYLVPRDFTGNYGPTVAAVVVVPNKIRPPAPWELRSFVDQTGQLTQPPQTGMAISWDKVNLDNYLDVYNSSRRFCNIVEAQATGVLEFVGKDEDCDRDPRRSLRLDVSDYVVYRFENFEDARTFKDSDGDGYSDADEENVGTQCQFNNSLSLSNYAVAATGVGVSEIVLPNSGRATMRFHDLEPGSNRNEVYWYRVASKTPDNRYSLPSAPQRAIYPNRPLLPKPGVAMVRPVRVPDGGCEIVVDDPTGPWNFREEVGGQPFQLTCPSRLGPISTVFEADVANSGARVCRDEVLPSCNTAGGGSITLSYPEEKGVGDTSCTVTIPDDLASADAGFQFCSQGRGRLVPTYTTEFRPVETGDVIDTYGILTVTEPAPDTCVTLYENIDGEFTKVRTSCNSPEDVDQIEYLVDAGFFCGYAVTQDADNNMSPTQVTPCAEFTGETIKPPATPQSVDFTVDAVRAAFSWRLPVEPVAVTLVRLDHRSAGASLDRQIISIPAAGAGSGEVTRHTVDIPELVGDRDEWCVSFRAIGPAPKEGESLSSDWSSPRCEERRNDGQGVPEYLPWPAVRGASEGPDLTVGIQRNESASFTLLYLDILPLSQGLASRLFFNCSLTPLTSLLFVDTRCNVETKLFVDVALDPELPFIVYRQSERPDSTPGDWIQVSPLIEYAHWDGVSPTPEEPKSITVQLRDPYIKLRSEPIDSAGLDDLQAFVFVDQYPVISDYRYRYQLVYFSRDHRIVRWRQSDWITYTGGF